MKLLVTGMHQFGPLAGGLATLLVAVSAAPSPAPAHADAFTRCVQNVWPAARRAGVSRATFEDATEGLTPDPKTLELMKRQSEFVKPIWEYLDSAVSDTRVANGRRMLRKHRATLDRIAERFRVDPEVVVAIWGMETSYGNFMGDHNAIRALATLACNAARRREFWRGELVQSLRIVEGGHISARLMESSWAGAMGHTQFMPSSWKAYAADYDGDGRRDVWTDIPDALASTANYLHAHGWVYGKTWGYEVVLPKGFDHTLADGRTRRSLRAWAQKGIRRANGREFPRPDDQAYLLLPAGARGPAFLMLKNFDVIKRYNNADAYALGVGHLADRILGGGPIVQAWPKDERPLTRGQVREMQAMLSRRGFSTGGVDGKVGPKTRAAIRAFQEAAGEVPDGYASTALLNALKRH